MHLTIHEFSLDPGRKNKDIINSTPDINMCNRHVVMSSCRHVVMSFENVNTYCYSAWLLYNSEELCNTAHSQYVSYITYCVNGLKTS